MTTFYTVYTSGGIYRYPDWFLSTKLREIWSFFIRYTVTPYIKRYTVRHPCYMKTAFNYSSFTVVFTSSSHIVIVNGIKLLFLFLSLLFFTNTFFPYFLFLPLPVFFSLFCPFSSLSFCFLFSFCLFFTRSVLSHTVLMIGITFLSLFFSLLFFTHSVCLFIYLSSVSRIG